MPISGKLYPMATMMTIRIIAETMFTGPGMFRPRVTKP